MLILSSKVKVFYGILSIILMFSQNAKAGWNDCNTTTGPSGITDCVELLTYYKPQIATCLSNHYVITKAHSKNDDSQCGGTYCWVLCMQDVYNINHGSVYDDCSCDPNATLPVINLPGWCFSPDGTQCNWYRDCLEKRYPCNGTKNSYALDYAEHFCDLYEQRLSKFSTAGQKWINGVRKCLQMDLVTFLRPWNHGISCEQIKEQAFSSHSSCYVSPGFFAPSICDIGVKDWWSIFWTIKGSFTKTPLRSLTGIYEVASQCAWNIFTDKDDVSLIHLDTDRNFHSRKKRGSPSKFDDDKLIFAEKVGESIAKTMGWSKMGISWLSFHSNTAENRVQVLVSSKKKFDLNAENSSDVSVSNTIQLLAKAVSDGSISIADGARITRMVGCDTSSCNSTFIAVDGSLTSKSGNEQYCGFYMQLFAAILVLYAVSN